MKTPPPAREIIRYRRSRFTARLPTDLRYVRAHYWLREEEPGVWCAGFTQFATRMLGDLVEIDWEPKPGQTIEIGSRIGWVEGFKALTELYSVVSGEFAGGNTALDDDITLTDRDPYGDGWLYRVRGVPDAESMDVNSYVKLLDETIDLMMEKYGDA